MTDKITFLRFIGYIEGWSYLILLFIAMPIKYILGFAIIVKIVGMIHGVLFTLFVIALINAALKCKWDAKFSLLAFISSLIPYGTFFLNKKLRQMY